MKPHEILTVKEFYEPETIRFLFPQLTEEEQEQLQVLQALTYNLAFWQDPFVFENAVLSINGVKPEVGFMQGCTPTQIWYAAYLVNQAFPDREYEPEIKTYIRFMSNQQGVYIYPPQIFKESENPYYKKALELEAENTPLGDSSIAEIQAGHLATIQLYIRLKQDDEKIKIAQDKKGEAYYTKEPPLDKEAGSGKDFDARWTWFNTKSLYFPEEDNYASRLVNPSRSLLYEAPASTDITIALWYKYESPSSSIARTILSYGWSSLIQVVRTGGGTRFSLKSGTAVTVTGVLTDGAWHHIALTTPSSSSGLLYINGVPRAYVTLGNFSSATDVILGASSYGISNSRLKGNVNELATWNTILTSGEIYQLATSNFNYTNNYGAYISAPYLRDYFLMGDGPFDSTARVKSIVNESVYFTNDMNNLQFKFETA